MRIGLVLDLGKLRTAVQSGTIDTVVAGFVDMQGRLMGKRLDGDYFLEHADHGVDVCSSLLTLDMESDITPGYEVASLETGYGDFALRFDLATLRRMPWHEATALVLGDLHWHDGASVNQAPRAVLQGQVERARGSECADGLKGLEDIQQGRGILVDIHRGPVLRREVC